MDYIIMYVGLIALLTLSLMYASIPKPAFKPRVLISAISAVAYKPTSTLRIRLFVLGESLLVSQKP